MSAFQNQQGRGDRWCIKCQCSMDLAARQSCALPKVVVHSKDRWESSNYGKHLIKLGQDEAVPPECYGCGAHLYRCPECGRRKARLTLFFPDGQQVYTYEHGELDSLFR